MKLFDQSTIKKFGTILTLGTIRTCTSNISLIRVKSKVVVVVVVMVVVVGGGRGRVGREGCKGGVNGGQIKGGEGGKVLAGLLAADLV